MWDFIIQYWAEWAFGLLGTAVIAVAIKYKALLDGVLANRLTHMQHIKKFHTNSSFTIQLQIGNSFRSNSHGASDL